MAVYEFTNAPHWHSANSMVRNIWQQIHIRAIKHRGKGFTFDFLMLRDEYWYRYNTGLFSSGWEMDLHHPKSNDPVSSGNYFEKEKQFKAARQILLPYIHNYSFHTVQVEDGRTRTAKKGDTACQKTEYFAKIQVLDIISASIYNYYETEGTAFKNRICASQPALLNKLCGYIHYDIGSKVKYLPNGHNKFSLRINAEKDCASCGSNHVVYKDFGLVPLSTLGQCYGLFLAMTEEVTRTATKAFGYDCAITDFWLYVFSNKMGVSGNIEITVQKSLRQW